MFMNPQTESLEQNEVNQSTIWPSIPQEYKEVLVNLKFKEELIKNIPSFILESEINTQEIVVNGMSYTRKMNLKLRIVYMGEVDVDGVKSQEFHSSFNMNNNLDLFREPYYEDIHCECLNNETELKQYINFLIKNITN